MNNRSFRWIVTVAMVVLVIFALQKNNIVRLGESEKPLDYTAFLRALSDHSIQKVEINKDKLTGEYLTAPIDAKSKTFTVTLPPSSEVLKDLMSRFLIYFHF